jgi:uncharacterized membrane protein
LSSNQTAWDLAFLALGALLVISGWALAQFEKRHVAEPG